jgi:hypothetical protein
MQAAGCSIQRLLLVFVDVLHIEGQNYQICPSNSPLNVEVRRPSANARVAGVREDPVRRYSRINEADVAAPDRAILRFLKVGSHIPNILLHAFGAKC